MEARIMVALFEVFLLVSCVSSASLQLGPADNSSTEMLGSSTDLYYMNEHCNTNILVKKAARVAPWRGRYPPQYSNCVMYLSARNSRNEFVITFQSLDMSPKSGGICIYSKLDMFNGHTTLRSQLINDPKGICGDRSRRSEYVTNVNILTMEFTTKQLSPHMQQYFEAVITPFHMGSCTSNEFKCKNGRCINKGLICNSYNNCGDDSDEDGCAAIVLSIAAIVGIVLGAIVIVGIITAVVICRCCCRMLKYDRF